MIGLIVNYDELVCESMLIIMTIDKRILLLYELGLVVNTYASSLNKYVYLYKCKYYLIIGSFT